MKYTVFDITPSMHYIQQEGDFNGRKKQDYSVCDFNNIRCSNKVQLQYENLLHQQQKSANSASNVIYTATPTVRLLIENFNHGTGCTSPSQTDLTLHEKNAALSLI